MSIIFKFRLLSDEVEDFVRDYEVPFDMTLFDFHNYIRKDLGYSPCELASFFKSDAEWEKLQEFTLFDMGTEDVDIDPHDDIEAPVPMSEVKLSLIITQKFDRLIYVFDMLMERSLYIELLESQFRPEGVEYPRTVLSEGAAPVQFKDDEDEDIFKEAMGEFSEFEGDENLDDE